MSISLVNIELIQRLRNLLRLHRFVEAMTLLMENEISETLVFNSNVDTTGRPRRF
jgi:hypothetical protein